MLEKPIKLPIYFHSKASAQMEDLDIEIKYSDLDVRSMYFYKISSIIETDFDGTDGTLIYSDGELFECPLSIENVLQIIEKHLNNIKFIVQ